MTTAEARTETRALAELIRQRYGSGPPVTLAEIVLAYLDEVERQERGVAGAPSEPEPLVR
jgi:hypothetical protein